MTVLQRAEAALLGYQVKVSIRSSFVHILDLFNRLLKASSLSNIECMVTVTVPGVISTLPTAQLGDWHVLDPAGLYQVGSW